MRRRTWTIGAILAVAACNQMQSQGTSNATTSSPANVEAPVDIPPPRTGPDAHTPLGQASSVTDQTSVEAAAQVVRRYADLMDNGQLSAAEELWSDQAAASAFARQISSEVHVEIGRLGSTEGAAGSVYITIPVVFVGNSHRKPADVVLRRVNDVPGSSEADRHWHIARIDLKTAA